MDKIEITEIGLTDDTPLFEYIPKPIDEYLVIVNDSSDWDEVHNYIIKENEIDGIPNRKIECSNLKEYSLRSSVYVMSREEAEVLRTHSKVESVILNPDKYPLPESRLTNRFKKVVAFNKPSLPAAVDTETTSHTNGVRSNWSNTFVNGNQSSEPYQGVGIATVTISNSELQYSLTGKNVDAVIIDEGIGAVHPEFLLGNIRRVKDLVLDGPYKVDPDYFINNNYTYTKVIDGVDFGVGISTTAAQSWWTNSSNRSAAFQSLGTISSIDSRYTIGHTLSKTTNSDGNQITGGHGTACASQIGGKSFGLAFECNLWNIRISFGDAYLSAATALDICTIFHNAKKISQSNNPDPTLINNSYGTFASTGNTNGVNYNHVYRGSNLTYSGTGDIFTVPANSGACRNTTVATFSDGSITYGIYTNSSNGQYLYPNPSSNSSTENAINSGCIVVASAGNNNQKLSDASDVDYNNYYNPNANYICRAQGVQKGFSGTDTRSAGAIRVGALDCAVEPPSAKQGATAYSVRKVCYSANGPMIDIWAPAEMTMAAGYANYEDYQRDDDANFYDTWFNGTSAAGPNACAVIALYLETNRKATQADVKKWLNRHGSVEIDLSDPYSDINDTGYWTQTYNQTFDAPENATESYNIRGNGNLRGAPKKVLNNPFANNVTPKMKDVNISGILFTQS